MKYFTNLLMFLAWYLDKISDINTTRITQEEQIQKLRLSEMWRSDFISDLNVMITLKRNVLILTRARMHNIIYSENTTRISVTKTNNIASPRNIAKAPDGVFGVPSYTIISSRRISQLDVSDPMKPIINYFIEDSLISSYGTHVWINENEILFRNDGLIHFEIVKSGIRKKWNTKKVTKGKFDDLFVFQYDPKSFVVLYATSYLKILIMWPEDAEGKPGDWRNEEHIKEAYIDCNPKFITSADVNNDGKTDILVSLELREKIDGKDIWYTEIRAFEIPHSEEFKNPDKYMEHVLFTRSDYDIDDFMCITHLKTFIPFVSYKGKAWILVGEDKCGGGSYLQPRSEDVGKWSYKRNKFFSSNGTTVNNIEVADIDQDGYTELYILADRLYVYSFSSGKIIVTDPPSTPLLESNISSTPSSSSILYLDSTLLMFIGLAFTLRLV